MWPFNKDKPQVKENTGKRIIPKLTVNVYETKKKELKGLKIETQINPSSYTMSEGSSSKKQATLTGEKKQSGNDQLRKLSMTIDINSYGEGNYGIKHRVREFSMLKGLSKIKEPYICKLSWSSLVFWCNLDSYSVTYTMFDTDGTPVRARMDLSFDEYIDDTEDPAGAGDSSEEDKTVKDGERMDTVGGTSWKSVAQKNNIDNPRKLGAGQSITK